MTFHNQVAIRAEFLEAVPTRQFFALRGDAAGNVRELLAARQIVFDDDELLVEFRRHLYDRRQDHHERAILLPMSNLLSECLYNLGALQEPMKVREHQDRRLF